MQAAVLQSLLCIWPLLRLALSVHSTQREREGGGERRGGTKLFGAAFQHPTDRLWPPFIRRNKAATRSFASDKVHRFVIINTVVVLNRFPRETGRHFLQNVPRFRENRHQFRFLHDSFRSTHSAISVFVPIWFRSWHCSTVLPCRIRVRSFSKNSFHFLPPPPLA